MHLGQARGGKRPSPGLPPRGRGGEGGGRDAVRALLDVGVRRPGWKLVKMGEYLLTLTSSRQGLTALKNLRKLRLCWTS
jgi:hypothetical protein